MSTTKIRVYLIILGAAAIAAGLIVQWGVLSRSGNDRVLGGVALFGGVAMILTALIGVNGNGKKNGGHDAGG